VSFGYGLQHDPSGDKSIPDEVRQRIENAWDTEWLKARKQLRLFYSQLSQTARRDGRSAVLTSTTAFDRATRVSYFDGVRAGHSLMSGLALINRCLSDDTVAHKHFSRDLAVMACDIACLSMLFHDQHCRETMGRAHVSSIPFRYLPYATILMFVDALQDDRRDVRTSRFRTRGVLDSLQIHPHNGLVKAEVILANLPLRDWPRRIAEYESVMNWINPKSDTKFLIEYTR
jgi:hypothetical protein